MPLSLQYHLVYRCRSSSKQIFGGAKHFCPNFSKLAPKIFRSLVVQIFSQDRFWDDLQKRDSILWFWVLGIIFFKWKHIGHHFCLYFQGLCLPDFQGFSEGFKGFHRFCPDFCRFCLGFTNFAQIFTKWKLLGCACTPCSLSPTSLIWWHHAPCLTHTWNSRHYHWSR